MLSRRTFLGASGLAVAAWPVALLLTGDTATADASPEEARQSALANLVDKNFGIPTDHPELPHFLDFMAREHGELLRPTYDDDEWVARQVTTLFVLNSNLPENGFDTTKYEYERRPSPCNPFAVFAP
jgi:hypothetical protein